MQGAEVSDVSVQPPPLPGASKENSHLVKNILYFSLLVLKGLYHYWICLLLFKRT